MPTLEEIQKRRAARFAKHDKDREAQETLDLEAIDALEAASGEPLHTMTANGYKAGVAVKVAFRTPSGIEYKRYADTVTRFGAQSPQRLKAQHDLADVCWLYPAPDSDARKAMLEAFPGLLVSIAIEAAKVAEANSDVEGKG